MSHKPIGGFTEVTLRTYTLGEYEMVGVEETPSLHTILEPHIAGKLNTIYAQVISETLRKIYS